MSLIDYAGLAERGITLSARHIHRKVLAGTFPKPVKIGDHSKRWIESEIQEWIEARVRERDAGRQR